MTPLPDKERTLAHFCEAMAECDRSHSSEDLEAAQRRLKEYVDSLSPVEQYQLLAGPK
jgi:hypothetical protein